MSEKNYETIISLGSLNNIHIEKIATVKGSDLRIDASESVSVAELINKNSEFFEKYTSE